MSETDAALRLLGKYSRWQMRTFFMYAIGFSIPFAWMAMSIVFIGKLVMARVYMKSCGYWLLVS